LVISTQDAECSEPRDILYSIWAISRENRDLQIRPRYNSSIAENYIDFVKAYAKHTGSLDIICASQAPAAANLVLPGMPTGWNVDLELPSWCPDWRSRGFVSSLLRRTILYDENDAEVQLGMDNAPYHADTLEPNED